MSNTTTGGFALTNDQLEAPPAHIPDGKGGAYKSELVLFRSPERTEKIIWWYADDPRPEPHNHPWRFESTILSGGYTEDRWWIDERGELQKATIKYRANDRNRNVVESNVFHVVRDVQPDTTTKLLCGQASKNNEWGYLDLATKEYYQAEKDLKFIDYLREINPHMRSRSQE